MCMKQNTNYLHLLLNGHWTLELRIFYLNKKYLINF